jgi:hypothetical protein
MTDRKPSSVGVPYDPDAFDRTDALYGAIERGDHDQDLDAVERAVKARQRAASHPRMTPWTGPAPTTPLDGIRLGYYDNQGTEGMKMLLAAVRNRRSRLAVDAMKAATRTSTIAVGDHVRIKADAPLRPTYILGKTGTVTKVNQTTATVVFDPGQYLGRFEPARPGQGTRCPLGSLEKVDAPAPGTEGGRPFPLTADDAATLADLVAEETDRIIREDLARDGAEADHDHLEALRLRLAAHAKGVQA